MGLRRMIAGITGTQRHKRTTARHRRTRVSGAPRSPSLPSSLSRPWLGRAKGAAWQLEQAAHGRRSEAQLLLRSAVVLTAEKRALGDESRSGHRQGYAGFGRFLTKGGTSLS
jgi:hypothetical protein